MYAVLKAFEIIFQLGLAFAWQRVNHPILLTLGRDHPSLPQIGKMLRNLDLRLAQDLLEVADAKRRFC